MPSIDKVNTVYYDGLETELFGMDSNGKRIVPYTIDEYKEKFSKLESDGKLYWKE